MEVDRNPPLLNIISRQEWGGEPPKLELENLRKPCICIRLWLYSDTPECDTKEECIKTVREIQQRNFKEGLDDIRFNFLVGGDLNIYEGRGYDKMPPKDPILSEVWGRYLEVCMIGNHRVTQRNNNRFYVMTLLAEEAEKNGTTRFNTYLIHEDT